MGGTVAFPSVGHQRSRHGSISSISSTDIPPPVSPFHAQAGAGPRSRTQSQSTARRPVQRHTGNSSASLFFRPSDPGPESPTRPTLRPDHSAHQMRVKMGRMGTPIPEMISLPAAKRHLLNPLPSTPSKLQRGGYRH